MYHQIDHPVSIGEKLKGLDIPSRTKSIHFKRESNDFNGDGYKHAMLELTVRLNDIKRERFIN